MFQKDFTGNGLLNFLFELLYVKKKKKSQRKKKEKKQRDRHHITIEKTSILCLKICKYNTIYAFNLAVENYTFH